MRKAKVERATAVKAEANPVPGIDSENKIVTYDYVKSSLFRVIHVDGVFGGVTPNGKNLFLTLWNERWPIPKSVAHSLSTNNEVGEEKNRVTRNAIVREVETQILMDIEIARSTHAWLGDQISRYDAEANKIKTSKKASKK